MDDGDIEQLSFFKFFSRYHTYLFVCRSLQVSRICPLLPSTLLLWYFFRQMIFQYFLLMPDRFQKSVTVALRVASETSLAARELKNEDLNQVLSEFSQVHSASESNSFDDVPDLSELISSSVSRIRDCEVGIRWHQRKEALFIGYTNEARIACQNMDMRLSNAIALFPASNRIHVLGDAKPRSKMVKQPPESFIEPSTSLLFSNIFKHYDFLQSLLGSTSLDPMMASEKLVELTLHNSRVQITDSDVFPDVQTADQATTTVATDSISILPESVLNSQPVKPKSSGGIVPSAPSMFFSAVIFLWLYHCICSTLTQVFRCTAIQVSKN